MKHILTVVVVCLVYFGTMPSLFALPTGMPTPAPTPADPDVHYAYRGVVMDNVFEVSDTTVQAIQKHAKFVKIWTANRNAFICVMIVGVFDNVGLFRDLEKGDRPLESFDSSVGSVIVVPVDDGMCPFRP